MDPGRSQPPTKKRKTRWGVVEGGATSQNSGPSPVVEGPRASQESQTRKPRDVQQILSRIGDLSDVLNRARASKGQALLPRHATLRINQALPERMKSTKVDPKNNPFYDPTIKTKVGLKPKLGALRFVTQGYYVSKQRRIEKKLGVEADQTLDSVRISPPDSEVSTQQLALAAALEFVGARKSKHEKAAPLSVDALASTTKSSGQSKQQVTEPVAEVSEDLDWWDMKLLIKLTPETIEKKRLGRGGNGEEDNAGGSAPGSAANGSVIKPIAGLLSEEELRWFDREFPYEMKKNIITHLVQHPVPIEPIADRESAIAPAIYLTLEERKRMRRQRNKEREQDKRDKIQMGLIEPDPPKVKLSNLMRVLGDEAVTNPTAIEMKVRQQVAERLKAHEQRNRERQLTDERRREKTKEKWVAAQETSVLVQVTVFQLKDITDKQCLYKIHQNAKDYHMTGAAILCPGVRNLVIVEGSSRAVKRYKALMMRRIKWPEPDNPLDPFCKLVWEGPMKGRCFKYWQMCPCRTLEDVKSVFDKHEAAAYWTIVENYRDQHADLV
ncbi:pre-mRNA processing factor 3 (Prp3) [Gregarina niphandrodes]|uniref:Pre-mRNA processing factor 3 (Prp3) n=1 Tax=Gregarina niphandrodes TaxID=110365 RepID=A0A023B371_GRENI|nr:pre-mRNA processing factor 3 (Prp3) [Gregarina niphandrodes]EZG55334.1 pre-mRNA processing factor 3 (Prp3) [Gregarina niphandrodes]|eukprot:XP_011131629.1 pre-mRNA processing factor 3 (Prp3) [Gregarina niphandrodes]